MTMDLNGDSAELYARCWQISDEDELLLVNMISGTYFGCSTSMVRKTYGRLFSTCLNGKHPEYHMIAWEEL